MTDKYELISAEKDNYPVTKMRFWLDVSTSGYYEWSERRAGMPVLPARLAAGLLTPRLRRLLGQPVRTRRPRGVPRVPPQLRLQGLDLAVRLLQRRLDRGELPPNSSSFAACATTSAASSSYDGAG